ncbi:glycosyltransferase family 2 protein [Butyrivibrio sp. WCD2001]|uniref:glycosyltransferase family 2 protein n=1 Tax=Butyrivibrio sp. WCD2001 TaxID=1280681 RepID=UPI00047BC560|nr:glycosyltransferase family 2 protein [Butyrivibrio sp. WCD2001]
MDDKLVSIVMPTYNGSNYIDDSIKALINQTYKNLEIIIVDDGSTDSVIDICEKYMIIDKRIRVISTKNRGVSAARNIGISEAKGDYIVFVDDDDYPSEILIEKYLDAYDQWKDKEVSLITCGMTFKNTYNKRVNDKDYILESGRGYVKGENYLLTRNYAATLAWLKLFNFVTNKCYDLGIIKKAGIKFDETISVGEDLKFNIDYLENSEGYIGMINLPLYFYIKRKVDGLSVKYHSDDLKNTKEIYRRFIRWENEQEDVTDDNIIVLKSLFIHDWTNRLTAIYQMHKGESPLSCAKRSLNRELRSREFRTMLHEVRKAKKIRMFRYICLRTGNYEVFFFFRRFYQFLKG